jgi:DNA-binding NtrC family response regulator
MARILLIDDDADFGELLHDHLTGLGHTVHFVGVAEDGLNLLSTGRSFDVILLDNKLPRMSGIEFLSVWRERGMMVPVILMTSAHKDQTVIEAMNLGADSYVIKPLNFGDVPGEFDREIQDALNSRPPVKPVLLEKPAGTTAADESVLIGTSKPMLDVLKRIGRLARMEEPVLILGETGTGKDLVARAIHTNSARKHKPFVVMNCAAFNDNLLDDELFGHEPGAFTGADKLRKGRFEHAQGGTLFLDEVGDMPLTLQVKLLRVLENREVVRIGSNEPIKVDVRVISATHRDLKAAVRTERFRQDLYYRLEGITIHLPPLRERREDIPLLADSFLARIRGAEAGPVLHPHALARLMSHDWPGNIRQLQKVLCRAVGQCRGAQVLPDDLEFGESETCLANPPLAQNSGRANEAANDPGATAVSAGLRAAIAWAWDSGQEKLWPLLQEKLELELLRFALAQPGISQVQLARRLGVARNTLRARIEQYGLKLPDPE